MSSIKRTVSCLYIFLRTFAVAIIFLTSATPLVTAEKPIKSALTYFAISFANVVLPHPGGPHKIIEVTLPLSSIFRIGAFLPTRCSCPTNSSKEEGRSCSARGIPIEDILTQNCYTSFMPKIKFIYFDIGGVLLDWYDSFKTATKEFNIPYDEFKKLWLRKDFVDDMTRGKIVPQDLWKEAIKKFNLKNVDAFDFLSSWVGDYRPRKDVHKAVYQFSKKYRIGLISNLYKGMLPKLLELRIVPDITYSSIILSCDTGFRKTEKEIYE